MPPDLLHDSASMDAFESAIEAIITGDAPALELLLRVHPDLTQQRSTRVHHATLLHYVAANGVEDELQKTPPNAASIAKMLLEAGAAVDALADMYGAKATTLEMVVSSVHPARAGVQVALVDTLLDYGAAVNGVDDDGKPLMTALAFGYGPAAEKLVARGARIDDIVAGAALGRLDVVQRGGSAAEMEKALIWAATFDRAHVVEFLLRAGVDMSARGNQGFTALHAAAFHGATDATDVLLRWKAPLEIKNDYDGTVLGQTVWACVNKPYPIDYVPIAEKLLEAGADMNGAWYPTGDERMDEVLRRYGAG